ncbi:MAG TPA: hypothetical protein VLM38_16645 [Blastocatellia bacterium]|nr:hypothetical protein [Blastocatellia bacterium]
MNCKDVEAVVNDLARDQIMEASLREASLSHAASCSNCAIRLDDARSLTGGLRWLAAAAAGEEAPARLEASLLAAFRENRSATPRIELQPARTVKQRWLYVAAGIAAAAAIVMLISLIASRTQNSAPSVPQQAVGSPSGPDNEQAKPKTSSTDQREVAIDSADHKRRAATKHARPPRPRIDSEQSRAEVEIATDFIPLVHRGSLTGLDSGQLVRVELPRSALMTFGLPIDMDRANEPVKADVVVGQDGLARAIRFVR